MSAVTRMGRLAMVKGLKKFTASLMTAIMIMSISGCGSKNDNSTLEKNDNEPVKQVTENIKPTVTPNNATDENKMPDEPDRDSVNSIIPGRVEVKDTDFVVDGEILFMNGVNTPWDNWNDFGGSYDEEFWNSHFSELHENGVNASRVWISCNGDVGFDIDQGGYLQKVSDKYWTDLDSLFKCAEENGIYIMATIMSFDHFKNTNKTYNSWRWMLRDTDAIDTYINEFIIPFCERYDDYDSLWSIDLCNEPDWIYENDECGKIDMDDICMLFSREAAAIHEHSDILVTIGFGMIKYNSDRYEGNYGSDEYLMSLSGNDNSYLDFYSPHFYDWEAEWFGYPFDKDPVSFGVDGTKPAVIGEFPASGTTSSVKNSKDMSGSECYINAYNNGWNGAMAWTSNGSDANGNIKDFKEGVNKVAAEMSK